jgi:hypothetical protein
MKKLKGPDLKLPELKAPAFLADLYYDLRDRRLLPVIALVLVAIVAVPILMGSDSESVPVSPAGGAATIGPPEKTSKLTVVEATPGLRDYRKRLRDRSPTDPFEQRYTGLPESAQVEASSGGGSGSASDTSAAGGEVSVEVDETGEAAEPAPAPSSGGGDPGGTSPGNGKIDPKDPGLRFYAFRPDVRFGVAGSDDLTRYENLPLGQLLPKQNPVIAFMGVSEDGKRVAFDISNEVAMVRGPGRCIGGNQSCSLLILRAGQAVDILTGTSGRAFRLAVTGIDFVEVERPKPAQSSTAAQGRVFDFSQSFIK